MQNIKTFIAAAFLVTVFLSMAKGFYNSTQREKVLQAKYDRLSMDFQEYTQYAKDQINGLRDFYDNRDKSKDHFTEQVLKYKSDANRSNIVLAKPGLVGLKINKSFEEFENSIYQETK